MDKIDWIMSEGGPLLLMEEALAISWMGVFGLSVSEAGLPNDYDRACRKVSKIFAVPVRGGTAFSLAGGGPLYSFFWTPQHGPLHLVQVEFGDDDEQCLALLQKLDPALFDVPDKLTPLLCASGPLVLFDSACSWTDPDKVLRASIAPGRYEIRTKSYETDRFLIILHRFDRL